MNKKILTQIYNIISINLGDSIVESYKKFYEDKSDEEILLSVQELLNELVGPKSATKQLEPIKIALSKK